MDFLGYLFAAYTIIFLAIFLYIVFVWRRQARLETELRTMEARLKDLREELASRGSQSRSAS